MNNVFQNNISALEQKNKILAQKLLSYLPSEVPEIVQENSSYNIKYKGKYVHNQSNPLGEAQEVFSMADNEPVSVHLIYGLGLGYLFQVASLNSKGTVILYEPDLNILWFAFNMVDFTSDIAKKNLYICSEYDEVTGIIYKKLGLKNTPQLLSIPSQRDFVQDDFEVLVRKLQNDIGSHVLDLNYTKARYYPSLVMFWQNLHNILHEIPLAKFKDAYKGKTAVVVSAGPTLDRNIEQLKKNRDKYILFTVGTAARTLYANNITPDFICIIETYNSSRQLEGLDISGVNLITEPYSNPVLRSFKFKNIYSHISANTPINLWWSEVCGENIEEYWSKGTVSYTALNCARLLGCEKIILVGQDLAYIGGQCYSKDSAYKDLICQFNPETNRWEITAKDFEKFALALCPSEDAEQRRNTAITRLRNLNSSLYYVKGIDGKMLPTESVYAAFIEPLSAYAIHFNDRKYINTSLVGAQIDGFENMSLEEALKDSSEVSNKELNSDFSYDKNKIEQTLRAELKELSGASSIILEGEKYIKNIKNSLKRRIVDVEVLKTLKKLALNYLSVSSDFADKSKMYDFITTGDKIDLDYEMQMMRDFTYENVKNITDRLSQYYGNATLRIKEIEDLAKGAMDESFNSAC